jgi:hypothetical protein
MVRGGIVFGHKVSKKGTGVDDSRMVALKRLPIPHDVKGVKNFLVHAWFYIRFIKYFAKLSLR